jgi:recombination protein RecA
VVFINQLRHKIGIMMPGQSPETTTGGNALKFYASVRQDIRRIGAVKKGDEIIGNQTKIKVVKNKLAPPFKQVITEILYGEGISREGELIEMGVDAGMIQKSGAWYSCDEERIGQGKENARQFLKENPAVAERIEAVLREKFVPQVAAGQDDAADEKE